MQQKEKRLVKCNDKDCTRGMVDLNDMFVAASRPVMQPDSQGTPQIIGMVRIYFHVECYYQKHPMVYGAEA